MADVEIAAELRAALSGLTTLEMAARGMVPVSKAMAEAHEAYTKLCGDRENIRALLDELDRLREERDMWKGRAEAAVMIGRSLTGARALSTQVEERE